MLGWEMKFAVGYQHMEDGGPFSAIVADYRDQVSEVYFPWVGQASGRPPLGHMLNENPGEIRRVLEAELQTLHRMGVKLDLLFNASCYGERAVSRSLAEEVTGVIEHLGNLGCAPEIITTTSLMIARTIKRHFPAIEVRASVNMRIGTIQAMAYIQDLFDSFYLQRDLQRNIAYVKKVRDWCDSHGKKLCLLANSGCLRFCPGQTFHDNLIAHSAGSEKLANLPGWNPHVCWNLYQAPEHFVEILRSTWIRPEEIHLYEGIVDTIKLATRQHSHPRMVLGAYAAGGFRGNLLDLLEPGFAPVFAPYVIDNAAFPPDWAERSSRCSGTCEACIYCRQTLNHVLVKLEV